MIRSPWRQSGWSPVGKSGYKLHVQSATEGCCAVVNEGHKSNEIRIKAWCWRWIHHLVSFCMACLLAIHLYKSIKAARRLIVACMRYGITNCTFASICHWQAATNASMLMKYLCPEAFQRPSSDANKPPRSLTELHAISCDCALHTVKMLTGLRPWRHRSKNVKFCSSFLLLGLLRCKYTGTDVIHKGINSK